MSCMIHIRSIKINNMTGNSSLNIGSVFHSQGAANDSGGKAAKSSITADAKGTDTKRCERPVWTIGGNDFWLTSDEEKMEELET